MSGGADFKNKFIDSLFGIKDNLDKTKQLEFQIENISSGTTRTLTFPDQDIDLSASGGTYQARNTNLTAISNLSIDKGDLIVGNGTTVGELGIGTDGQVLIADSAESLGMRWGAASSGDITGPGSSTNTAIARWSGTAGDALLDSSILIDSSANISQINNLKLSTSPSAGTAEGTLYWDSSDHTLAIKNDVSATTLQVGQELFIRVYNDSGSAITNGQLVYASGAQSSGEFRPTIALAQANSLTTASVIGAATHDIGNNEYGYVSSFGLVRNIDTSAVVAGDPLYLSPDTAGAFTSTQPVSPNYVKVIGFVVISDASAGKILVSITPDTSTPAGDATELTVTCRKDSAGTITAGQVVYQSGYNTGQGIILVELADADNASTMPALGIARDTFTNSASGQVVISGLITGQDTSAYSVGDQLYVNTTAGALTNTRPTAATTAVQKIGQVIRSNVSNGVISVVGAGRTNDIPNYQSDAIFRIADDGDTTKLIQFQASGITTATTRTITMPDQNVDLTPNTGTYPAAAGGTQITTLGTIATGTWQGTVVDEVYGGTGQSSFTTGDVLYASASNTLSKLSVGSIPGDMLIVNDSGVVQWDTDVVIINDDFIGTWGGGTEGGNWVFNRSATGLTRQFPDSGGHPGIEELQVSANSDDAYGARGLTSQPSILIGNGFIRLDFLIKIPTLFDVTDDGIIKIGLGVDTPFGTSSDYVFFIYDRATSTNWIPQVAASGSPTTASGGSSVAVDTNWTHLRIEINAGATNVDFWVDGVDAGSATTNIPSTALCPNLKITKTAGSSARSLYIDAFRMYYKLTSSRWV